MSSLSVWAAIWRIKITMSRASEKIFQIEAKPLYLYLSASPYTDFFFCIIIFYRAMLRRAHQPPTSLVVSICGPPVSGSWSFLVIAWTVSVIAVLLLRASRPGILYLTVFMTQHWVSTCLGVSWHKLFCEILTQRIRDLLIMRYINLHFSYLLPRLRNVQRIARSSLR